MSFVELSDGDRKMCATQSIDLQRERYGKLKSFVTFFEFGFEHGQPAKRTAFAIGFPQEEKRRKRRETYSSPKLPTNLRE
jgi:hypothetical protein